MLDVNLYCCIGYSMELFSLAQQQLLVREHMLILFIVNTLLFVTFSQISFVFMFMFFLVVRCMPVKFHVDSKHLFPCFHTSEDENFQVAEVERRVNSGVRYPF